MPALSVFKVSYGLRTAKVTTGKTEKKKKGKFQKVLPRFFARSLPFLDNWVVANVQEKR